MASTRWAPAAFEVAQVSQATISGYDAATTYKLTLNNQVISVLGQGGTVTTTATALAAAWNASTLAQIAEITATSSSGTVILTGPLGVPFGPVVSSVAGGAGTFGAISTPTAATGLTFWDNAANWSTSSVPTSGTNAVWTANLASGTASGGTFRITVLGQQTGTLAWNADGPTTVQTAVAALPTVGAGNVTVTGTTIGGGYVLTFGSLLGWQPITPVSIDGSALTGSTPVAQILNGTPGVTGDAVHFDASATGDCLYNISATGLAQLNLAAGYTGNFGLPKQNPAGYLEYRTDYGAAHAVLINIGLGPGQGSGRIKLDLGTNYSVVNVLTTGQGAEQDLEAVLLKGTNAQNVFNIAGSSSVGIAVYGAETAVAKTLKVDGSATVRGGTGLTITTLTSTTSGSLLLAGTVTTWNQTNGTNELDAGAVTTLTLDGGSLLWNSTGTLTTASLSGTGQLDFTADLRAKTVTNPINLIGGQCQLLDRNKVVAGLAVVLSGGAVAAQCDFGDACTVTRS